MVSAGFKSATEIFGAPSLIPRVWRWQNFVEVFTYQPFARQYFNSLYIALTVTVLTLVISSLAGYALARHALRRRRPADAVPRLGADGAGGGDHHPELLPDRAGWA